MSQTAKTPGSRLKKHRVLVLLLLNVLFIGPLVAGSIYISLPIRTQVDPYHHGFVPSRTGIGEFGPNRYLLHTNSLGFVDDWPRDVPLRSAKQRILFLGDSFTEGLGYPWDETFVGRVAGALEDEGVEVLNAAASSYSPIIYWRKLAYLLDEVGLKVDEVVVYIDISDAQDEAEVYELDPRGLVTRRQHRARASGDGARLNPTGAILPSHNDDEATSERYRINVERGLWTVRDDMFDRYGRAGLERMAKNMERLHALTRKHDLTLTIAVYPWPDQIRNHDLDSIQVRFWRDWTKQRGVSFLNYFPRFIDDDPDVWRTTLSRWFMSGSVHWNEDGHALVADGFLEHRARSAVTQVPNADKADPPPSDDERREASDL